MSKASKERRRAARKLLFGPGAPTPPTGKNRKPPTTSTTTPTPRQHAPKGSRVAVIREEHGWHDGQVTGVLIDDHGTVRVDADDPHFAGFIFNCEKRRDYRVLP